MALTPARVLAPAALLLVLVGCSSGGDNDSTPAPTGTVIPTLAFDIEGFPSYVVVPGRRYDLTVTSPRDSINTAAADEAGYASDAGDGRAFVGVRWDLERIPGDAGLAMRPNDLPVTASLVVDGERRDLGDLRAEGTNGAYVVVPDDADDIGLEIEYDGRTQVLEDVYDPITRRPSGNDDLYNEAPALQATDCPDDPVDTSDGFSWPGARCLIQVSTRLPYYGPVGWAPDGSSWVVATVSVDGGALAGVDAPGGYVSYDVLGGDTALTLNDEAPEELLAIEDGETPGRQDDGSWRAAAVFAVVGTPPSELVVDRGYRAVAQDTDEARAAGLAPTRRLRQLVSIAAP